MGAPDSTGMAPRARIQFLDGLRGLAIFWVVLFHAFVRWPEFVPYGDRYSGTPSVAYGWLGVQLFFLISGFVISMTLHRSAGFWNFMFRRWMRLFPAMALCSALIFLSAPVFPERPAGEATLRDLLPGLIFVDPEWLSLAFGSPQGLLEGAFWSLFVEMKFYVIAGVLYFLVGGRKMIVGLAGLALLGPASLGIEKWVPGIDLHEIRYFAGLLSLRHFGWFAAGALYYEYYTSRTRIFLPLAVLAAIASAAMLDGPQHYIPLFALSIIFAFTAAVTSTHARALLVNKVMMFFGFISYPLYLIHENMMVAIIVKVGKLATWMPSVFMPIIPMLCVFCAAWLVARFAEPWLRRQLREIFLRLKFKSARSSVPQR